MYDTSKEASNQQLYVRMLGFSINLSLLSRRTSKVQLHEIPRVKNSYNRAKIERKQLFLLVLSMFTPHNFSLTNRNKAKEDTIVIYCSQAFSWY